MIAINKEKKKTLLSTHAVLVHKDKNYIHIYNIEYSTRKGPPVKEKESTNYLQSIPTINLLVVK